MGSSPSLQYTVSIPPSGLPWRLSGRVIRMPMQETRVQLPGGEDLLEKEMATHSSLLPWKLHGQRSLTRELLTSESLFWPSF